MVNSMKQVLISFLALLLLSGCAGGVHQDEGLFAQTASAASQSSIPSETPTPTRWVKPTFTRTALPPTVPAETLQAEATMNAEATAIAKPTMIVVATQNAYRALCDEFGTDSYRDVYTSPDGNWVAISCGYSGYPDNRTMIVQNQQGERWVLDYSDFIDQEFQGGFGSFHPLGWSPGGKFLFFTKTMGWEGGGDECFPGFGVWGLYRLHLGTGNVVTLIPADDWSTGDEIKFSPSNEHYAVDINGVTITNVVNGKVTRISVNGVMQMEWSPDGSQLAFSVAKCDEEGSVETSSLYVWDLSTRQTRVLYSVEDMVLWPQSWIDHSKLAFYGETWGESDIYLEYDFAEDEVKLSATSTPTPRPTSDDVLGKSSLPPE